MPVIFLLQSLYFPGIYKKSEESIDKRPTGHIAHLRKIFTCFQYHFTNKLLSPLVEDHGSLFEKNLNFLYPRMLYAKFG